MEESKRWRPDGWKNYYDYQAGKHLYRAYEAGADAMYETLFWNEPHLIYDHNALEELLKEKKGLLKENAILKEQLMKCQSSVKVINSDTRPGITLSDDCEGIKKSLKHSPVYVSGTVYYGNAAIFPLNTYNWGTQWP